jgi:hypothetical protein
MGIKVKALLWAAAMSSAATLAGAETLYSVDIPTLTANALFDQVVKDSSVVTVKPNQIASSVDNAEALSQCLWSVTVSLDAGVPSFKPGKMICIGPEQEVLEALPQGEVLPFGQCVDDGCNEYKVSVSDVIEMTFSEPLSLNLQPRNERQ